MSVGLPQIDTNLATLARIPHFECILTLTPKPAAAFSAVIEPRTTSHGTVPLPATQMEFPATSTESSPPAHDKASRARDIVSHGTARLAVNLAPLASMVNTCAPCAVLPHTPPNSVPSSHDLLPIKTPFIPEVWETMLNDITPFNSFPDIPISLRFGFDMGVHTPPTQTYIPPNHNSALLFPDHVLSHIQKELSLGRYSSPFSRSDLESLIGPFRTSPLGTVPKTIGATE